MVDINVSISLLWSGWNFVQIPLWSILTLLMLLDKLEMLRSDSSMVDINDTEWFRIGGGKMFRFLYGRY